VARFVLHPYVLWSSVKQGGRGREPELIVSSSFRSSQTEDGFRSDITTKGEDTMLPILLDQEL